MRVITGIARGRKLREPEGSAIRPTTSMVKEALFNIIQFDIEGRRVLDLFAGTGQLGIEALSRGAASCDFVDSSKAAYQLVKSNLASSELRGGQVFQSDAVSFLSRSQRYDLIFFDPPYELSNLDAIIEKIVQFDILNHHGIIACETKRETILPEVAAPYQKGKEYRYGKVKITLYTRGEQA
ncbi:MAG: 16S rRNA (guanine(966)-N(2))-methyltransferase RsmD [Oscillospiraceae bacterium]|nr:16S rRNA (guanine(966)-N(2))-methyltransferase RsmD [Oscillospiraceae bacterium]